MKKLVIVLALLSICSVVRADGTIDLGQYLTPISNAAPLIKEGFFYDIKDGRGFNVMGIEVFNYKPFSGNLAYIGVDGAGLTVDYDLSTLPVENLPVLKYVEYLSVGYGAGVRRITLTDIEDNPSSDNQFVHGPVLYFKIKL